VTAKTHYLINNDVTSNSSKNKKAKELGVAIISEVDFLEMIGQEV
jgi:DNA ligase (NAD+)